MCGIAGKFSINKSEENIEVVKSMCNKLIHRGPDDFGLLSIGNIILGHRRLSIIDLSDNARQPMSTNDGRYHIVFNGEIYNFQEIRKCLKQKGIKFKSRSDTEVVLYAYAEYGANCLDKFNGMFAFAIWDDVKKKLFLARDRFGQKPLFYYSDNKGNFTFASEITALKEDKDIPFKLSYKSMNCYLALGYILNPGTMYEDVYQLEPASYLIVSSNKIIKRKYWNYANLFQTKTKQKENIIAENLSELLRQSVKRRMISDVPVGAFLSGGIDSSSIVSIMKKYHTGDLHTFSVGFEQKSYNELPDADKTAKWIDTKHHGLIVSPENNIEFINNAIDAYDQLFADNSLIPMIEISKLASKYVKVVLSGDAADEMFAGYITYKADKYYHYSKIIPYFIRYLISKKNINISSKKLNLLYKQKQFFNGTLYNYKKAHYLWRIIFNEQERINILGKKYKELVYDTDPFKVFNKYYDNVKNLDELDQHLYVDAMTWLTDDILVKIDRASMNSSIEARCPFLDIDLVTYIASIPYNLKLKGLKEKYILKKSLKNVLPDFVLKKKKSGFNAPVNAWLEKTGTNEFQTFNKYVFDRKINNV